MGFGKLTGNLIAVRMIISVTVLALIPPKSVQKELVVIIRE